MDELPLKKINIETTKVPEILELAQEDQGEQLVDVNREMADSYTKGLVPETDDPSEPSLSARAVFIGVLWGVILSYGNAFFSFRTYAFMLPSYLAVLFGYPMGVFFAKCLPDSKIFGVSLNPGK